jgi:hypothetical protein
VSLTNNEASLSEAPFVSLDFDRLDCVNDGSGILAEEMIIGKEILVSRDCFGKEPRKIQRTAC